MRNKNAAVELSVNFLVVIIITIVIFGFGIKFVYDLYSKADSLQGMTESEVDEKIGNLACDTSDIVCISADKKIIKKGSHDFFGVKIVNILDTPEFVVTVTKADPPGFKKDKSPILLADDHLILNWKTRALSIPKNEERTIGVGVQVPKDAVTGTYIFNIRIETKLGASYSRIQQIIVDVP